MTSAIGATSIVQPNDTHMHAEFSALYKQDEGNQEGGDGTYEDKAVRFNEMATVHYTEGGSTDAAAGPRPRSPTPDPVVYTGGDVRVLAAQMTGSGTTDRSWQTWWRNKNELSSRSSRQ